MASTSEILAELDNYLQAGGMFNPEEMEHHKVRDMILKCRERIDQLQKISERLAVTVRRIYAEQLPDTWFVCGELGEKDQNNLPKFIEVCPAYGVDWSQLYERTDRTIPGMGG